MNQAESNVETQSSVKNPSGQNKASSFQILKAVLWSMLGVRKMQSYEDDIAKITLKQAVVAGIIGGVIFVFTMLTMVNLAIKYLS